MESSSSRHSPYCWILGNRYKISNIEEIKRHTKSLIRLTYRNNFHALTPYNWLTSDAGWGCMLRSSQMLMACAFQRHYLGKDWRLPSNTNDLKSNEDYCKVILNI